jgi:cation diffusion facilitator CzcD-associated flavoprotein CzcO
VPIVGAGPSGLVAAEHALQAGFDVTVFEASEDLGGRWHATASRSADLPLHPAAAQIHAYLRADAEHSGVTEAGSS